MSEQSERLMRARIEAGFETAVDAARRFGWTSSYRNNESGTASFSFKKALEYAEKFKVRAAWLYAGIGPMREAKVPVIGRALAGPDGSYIDDHDTGDFEPLEPFNVEDSVAVIVDGTSMTPRFMPGEIAVFGHKYDDPSPLVNKQVLVRTVDGRRMIKILRISKTQGLWDLHSLNSAFDPIEAVSVDWARPFEGLRAN